MGGDGGGNLGGVGGDHHAADLGLLGPADDVDDHRQAGDILQRLPGQPGGAAMRAGINTSVSDGAIGKQMRSGL